MTIRRWYFEQISITVSFVYEDIRGRGYPSSYKNEVCQLRDSMLVEEV
jgi:hypothetical protein